MQDHAAGTLGALALRAGSAGLVGTWMWRGGDRHVLDRYAAELLAGAQDLADIDLPADALVRHVLDADRAAVRAALGRNAHQSGPVSLEYRVRTPDGVRWLLSHGRIYGAQPGVPAHGHGVLIDITARHAPDRFEAPEGAALSPLERAARHALAAREAVEEDGSASLRLLVDMFLLEVGRVIARRVGAGRGRGVN